VFKDSGSNILPGHVTDTKCRPDITAAFECDWKKGTRGPVVHWPFVRLAGEGASKGKNREDQEKQAISYLHYLILARPDLYVAQGVLTSKSSVTFLFGIGGRGVREFDVGWDDPKLHEFLYGFIYRLYDPGDFADSSYIETAPDEKTVVKYTITINVPEKGKKTCHGFYPVYAQNSFTTRTHVLSNPDSGLTIDGKKLTVLKDQLCRIGRRFKEYAILDNHVHRTEGVRVRVPGVVMATHDEEITYHYSGAVRCKHRLGLEENGLPFTGISSLDDVLETLFDVLEGI
jgi:hypothetical protein